MSLGTVVYAILAGTYTALNTHAGGLISLL